MNYFIIMSVAYAISISRYPLACSTDPIPRLIYLHIQEAQPIAEQGHYGLYDIRLARQALRQGEIVGARKFIDEAARLLTDQSTDWERFTRNYPHSSPAYDRYVAIHSLLIISEADTAKPWAQAVINCVVQKLQRGATQEPFAESRCADIYVRQHTFLLPLHTAQQAVADAQKLLNDRRYDEANVVLKSVEDSIIIDSVIVD